MISQRVPPTFQARRALLRSVAPRYQQACPAQKTLLLDAFVEWTGYTRKYAIELLNHGKPEQQTIQRRRLPQYPPPVQQALFLAWKATHYVCARRLLPSLPTVVALLERYGHLHLTEEERRQLLAMSVSTAQRYLRTQRKPRLHGLSPTTPGPWGKAQLPVCTFAQWEESRPGFVEMDLVAHCGDHLDGSFLSTLTLTDLATGWTECLPLLSKSAEAVLCALSQARMLFPFPLLGLDSDSGSEFLNAELIAYCEQEHLTFTRGRPGVKNDQCHVEQKNGAVVREAVGCARLEGVETYQHLREVYRALRLVVNGFQPSMKLQAKVLKGEQVCRVYDVPQTPLQRLLASGVLSETQQRALNGWVQQVDPLALSLHLDVLRQALLCGTHLPSLGRACGPAWSPLGFCLEPSASMLGPLSEEEPERTSQQEAPSSSRESLTLVWPYPQWTSQESLQESECLTPACTSPSPLERLMAGLTTIRPPEGSPWEDPWRSERIQRDPPEPLSTEPHLPQEAVWVADPSSAQTYPLTTPVSGRPGRSAGEQEADHLVLTTLEQAIVAYVQELRVRGRNPKTLQWHQTSLLALRRYLWRQFQLTDVHSLTQACLQSWVRDLHSTPSARTGARRTVSTVAAYARSARAFCNWLVRQGCVSEPLFPKDALPRTQPGLPRPVEPAAFVRLLGACQLTGSPGGLNASLTVRNRAILWLLRDTGLQVSELCRLRLGDVDRAGAAVRVQDKGGYARTFPLSADGQRALCAYLDQVRLTSAWEPVESEAQDRLLLTERRHSLTKNSLTLLFIRLSQRAGFTRRPICPSMLRDTYAIRFLQAEGTVAALQEQLGVAGRVSVTRYQRFCEQRSQQPEAQEEKERSLPPWHLGQGTRRSLQQRNE